MGTPREIVGQLTNLPWRAQLPDTLTGFRAMAPGESIRLVSIERPARALAGPTGRVRTGPRGSIRSASPSRGAT